MGQRSIRADLPALCLQIGVLPSTRMPEVFSWMPEVLSWGGSSAAEPCREMELVSIHHTEARSPKVVLIQSSAAAISFAVQHALLFGL